MAFIILEPWDFTQPLYGNGTTKVLDTMLRVLVGPIALVGATSGGHEVGKWTSVTTHGRTFDFLPILEAATYKRSRPIPANIIFAGAVKRHLRLIGSRGTPAIFTRTWSVLWILRWSRISASICFYYPGLANPWSVGQWPRLGGVLKGAYDHIQAKAIASADVAMAAASPEAVGGYREFLFRQGVTKMIHGVPTSVDCSIFRPRDRFEMRMKYSVPSGSTVFVFVGRLAHVKGIPLLFESLRILKLSGHSPLLLIVGDGESRMELQALCDEIRLSENVRFMGKRQSVEVAEIISCADVCVCGSYAEGFSNATLEQAACGKPIVSTDVSGAREIIQDGINGFVVAGRDPELFALKMTQALLLEGAAMVSRRIAEEGFSDKAVWASASSLWPHFGGVM